MRLTYVSVCSGIEAASLAWEPLGWRPLFFAEVAPFPSAVLAYRWPAVPNLGDMTKIDGRAWKGKADVLVGGTPCQAFSVAGARRGLNDARGNLTLDFARLADEIDPAFVVWENVPGVLSDKTNAFGCFLGLLAGENEALVPPGGRWSNAGYVLGPARAIAWRVLDAQYFGVAQRRRRVFLVACPRNGADPREILFEREGVRRDTPPSRETGQAVAPTVGTGAPFSRTGNDRVEREALVWSTKLHNTKSDQLLAFGGNNTAGPIDVATACNAHGGPPGRLDFESETFVTHALRGEGFGASEDGTGLGTSLAFPANLSGTQYASTPDLCPAMGAKNPVAVAYSTKLHNTKSNQAGKFYEDYTPALQHNSPPFAVAVSLRGREGGATAEVAGECCPAIRASQGGGDKPHVLAARAVRRLTPRECERLQGMPDDHTLIPWKIWKNCRRSGASYEAELIKRGLRLQGCTVDECPDGPRYAAVGNSKAVLCVKWLGRRIDAVAAKLKEARRCA